MILPEHHKAVHLHQSLHIAPISHQLHSYDFIVLIAYLAVTLLLGCYFIRKSRTPTQFTTAGGALPGWIVGLSIFGTYVSSISFLANPGSSFATNWNGFVFNIACVIATLFAIRFFIPYYRKYNSISAYALLEDRFGLWARLYTSICFILTAIARMGIILYLVAIPVNQLTGWSIVSIIIIIGGIIVVYTLVGGVEGVIYTIAMQSVVLMAGALLCLILIPLKTPGGIPAIFHIALAHHKFSFGGLSPNVSQLTFWVVLFFGVTNNLQNLGIDQNYVQRYITAKSEQAAKNSAWLSALLYLVIGAVFFFIGTALYSYYSIQPQLLTPQLAASVATGHGDQIFPFFIVNNLPYGLAGLVIAAIIAAAMSTISSNLNSSATLINEDYFRRFFKHKATDKNCMLVLYISTLIIGIIMIAGSLAMIHVKTALTLNWVLASIFGGGMLGLFLLSLTSRVKNIAAATGVIGGTLMVIYLVLSNIPEIWPKSWPTTPFHQVLIMTIATATVIVIGFLLTILLGKKSKTTVF
jgi:SSS family solute:Na+ symporter